jgi:hypothetical protein
VREAAQELDLLLDVVRYAKDDTADDGEIVDCNICLLSKVSIPKPLRLSSLCAKKKKGFPQRLERYREKKGTMLSSLCERLKSEQLVKI